MMRGSPTLYTVNFVLTHEDATPPYRKYGDDAGWDLYVSRDVVVHSGGTMDVHTDICMDMPEGLGARIVGRSSTLRNKGMLVNEGIIDRGYNGELFICVHNVSNAPFYIKAGSRIAQILFYEVPVVHWREVPSIQHRPGSRNNNGFGSTGE